MNIADVTITNQNQPIPLEIAKGGAMTIRNAKDIRFEARTRCYKDAIFTRPQHAQKTAIKEVWEMSEI